LIINGNFEDGFYNVPELGFEPPDSGWVPNDWNWFKNQAYGKYNIYNNEGLGLICPGDTIGRDSLSLHMQSTDQQDARLGVYQTVNVVPGQDYRFSMQGFIQAQPGAVGHNVELVFDQNGGTDWQAIPHEQWTLLPWREQELEFESEGSDDPDLARVETYATTVKARSNKLTVFISAWRWWPNWRTTIFSFDCLSLTPLSSAGVPPAQAVSAAASAGGAQAASQVGAASAPASTVAFPNAGGILETKENALLLGIVSAGLISGLVGAGVWNIRRQRRK
jgi:hypothetical protein